MQKIKDFIKSPEFLDILSSAVQAILTLIISKRAISKLQNK